MRDGAGMTVWSQAAVDLIRHAESYRPKAYQDDGGTWTIGWGHTDGVRPGMTCTREKAEQWFEDDMRVAAQVIQRQVKVPITGGMTDALMSFVFNFGETNFAASTLLKRINERDWFAASDEFQRWRHVDTIPQRGLALRRHREALLFLSERFPVR